MAFLIGGRAADAAVPQHLYYEDDEVAMRLVLRTPEQLTAFYLGREFSQAAIDRILQTCFVAAIIANRAYDVLWLELDNWEFRVDDRVIPRIGREYWKNQWREVALPQRHQSTFGWTLMPEARDLRLHESVGGNVVIPWQSEPFTLVARFATGADRQGQTRTIVFEDVTCLTDAP
jgi:hypothetical protein